MITPAQVLSLAASDMNDTARTVYTDAAMLPYFNMAVQELLQRMQESDIPLTHRENDQPVRITAGISKILIAPPTTPLPIEWVDMLPHNLVDIKEMWESPDGTTWSPVVRVDKISPNIINDSRMRFFGSYEWHGFYMRVPKLMNQVYLNIDYLVKDIPPLIVIADVDTPINSDALLFLAHKTAALCSQLVLQDEARAEVLMGLAEQAIERELNIPTKENQQIVTRRRPFRAAYKSHGYGR